MSFKEISLRFILAAFFFGIVFLAGTKSFAQFYDLEVKATDINTYENSSNVRVPIYMKNWTDSVVAFQITLTSDHPGTMQFISFDTSRALVSGWQMVQKAYSGDSIQILAMANTINPPIVHGIGYPQYGQVPLINLLANFDTLLDTSAANFYVDFIVDVNNFNFADENGNSIGLSYYEPTIDTLWFNCLEWVVDSVGDTVCGEWEELPEPPADTMIIDTILNPYIDTSKVRIQGGHVYIDASCVIIGDVNCSGGINLLDVTYLLNYLYKGGPAPCLAAQSDINCDCDDNLLDITCLIDYLYFAGSCTPCDCEQWEINCGNR
jgi:hypothetical protein